MARARIKTVTSEEVLFINRPLPPDTTDLILYVEDQITELLLPDESLSDTIYRFVETGDDLLIAVARKKTLAAKKPAAAGGVWYRIPSAIDLWLETKHALRPDQPSLIFGRAGSHAIMVYADSLMVRRVFQFRAPTKADLERDLLLSIENFIKMRPHADAAAAITLYSKEIFSNPALQVLRRRSVEFIDLTAKGGRPPDLKADLLDLWDFRLDEEINHQALEREKRRTILAGAIAAGTAAALWLLLAGADALIANYEARTSAKWQELRRSLKEITYLQKQLRQTIGEIMLCKTLSEKRTHHAVILEKIALTRPQELTLTEIRIGEKRKRIDTKAAVETGGHVVLLKGHSTVGTLITEWMDLLVKSGDFAGVSMVYMERKQSEYHFEIECAVRD